MRALAAVVLLAGCFDSTEYQCDLDSQCGGDEVCARSHECVAPGQVRMLRVTWDVGGMTDDEAACLAAGLFDLTITFTSPDATELTFTPVPCRLGVFPIDKLPLRFDRALLYGYGSDGYYSGSTAIGPESEVTIVL